MKKEKKIIQIMPADGWRAVYWDEETSSPIYSALIAFGLYDDGEVAPLYWEGNGHDDAHTVGNFEGLAAPGQDTPTEYDGDMEAWMKEKGVERATVIDPTKPRVRWMG